MLITSNTNTFPAIAATAHGMDAPYFIAKTWDDHAGLWLELHDGARYRIVGDTMYGYPMLSDDADNPLRFATDSAPCQIKDLEIAGIECWQTGGYCMVDVVRFAHGETVTITDEVMVFWPADVEPLNDDDLPDADCVSCL